MRLAGLVVVTGLIVTGCGTDEDPAVVPSIASGSGQEAPGSTVSVEIDPETATTSPELASLLDRAAAASDVLVASLGDETVATVTVLLSSDLGYSVGQIIDAAETGRLKTDGVLTAEGGDVVPPDFTPTLLLDENKVAAGFASPPPRFGVNAMTQWLNRWSGEDYGALILLTTFLMKGYSFEQIVNAVLTDQRVNIRVELVDENGDVVRPAGPPLPVPIPIDVSTTEVSQDGSVAPATEVAVPEQPIDSQPTTADASLAELVERAAGAYVIAPETATPIAEGRANSTAVDLDGALVVGLDGSVSGDVHYTVTTVAEDGYTAWWSKDLTFEPTTLSMLDDGLHFTTTVINEGDWWAENIAPHGNERFNDLTAVGLVDGDIGQIVVTGVWVSTTVDTIRFERDR